MAASKQRTAAAAAAAAVAAEKPVERVIIQAQSQLRSLFGSYSLNLRVELSSSVTAVSAAPGRHNSLLLAKIVVVFLQLALLLLPLRHSASFLLPPVVIVVHFQFALRTRNLSALYTRHMLRLH